MPSAIPTVSLADCLSTRGCRTASSLPLSIRISFPVLQTGRKGFLLEFSLSVPCCPCSAFRERKWETHPQCRGTPNSDFLPQFTCYYLLVRVPHALCPGFVVAVRRDGVEYAYSMILSSFLFIAQGCSIAQPHFSLFIHSLVESLCCCFQVLLIKN